MGMRSTVVVTKGKPPAPKGKASTFAEGTILICKDAPSGFLYAVGFVAIKGYKLPIPDYADVVLQYDGTVFRTYSTGHQFYENATFEEAEPGTTITITARQ